MDSERFLATVQADLDAGRDPLDSAAIVAWLEDHPESLEVFADLRAVGMLLESAAPGPAQDSAAPPRAGNRWWRPVVALAAAAAAAAALLLAVLPTLIDPQPLTPPTPQAADAAAATLLTYSASSRRRFVATDLAPADPVSGAVVLSMRSDTRYITR
jgi:hypothetical protein